LGNLPDTQIVVLAIEEALRTKKWQEQELTPPQLSLLQRVWEHLEKGVALGLDEAVNLRNREVSERLKKRAREEMMSGDRHSYDSGDYRGNLAVEIKIPPVITQVDHFLAPEYQPH
jgi:hypothetical protein